MSYKMDLEVHIKQEPIWLEETENTEHVSEMIPLKKEAKSELTEPGPMQESSFEPSADVKEEIFTEQHTGNEVVPFFEEDTKWRPDIPYADHRTPDCCDSRGKLLSLKRMQTHDGRKPYCSNVCDKSFSLEQNLTNQTRTYTGDTPCCCELCGKFLSGERSLSRHRRTHIAVKHYCCNICGKSFSLKNNLTTHRREAILL
ncbi:zinc finger protein 614 [Anabrus simplex]|uniref:zinc finger protein 614 n=1 Tax=Anabrus simplex TaxID=316456 RepID=UPI0035A2DAE2